MYRTIFEHGENSKLFLLSQVRCSFLRDERCNLRIGSSLLGERNIVEIFANMGDISV